MEGGEFNYDIRTFANATMYPRYNNNKKNFERLSPDTAPCSQILSPPQEP
jgi:hypothetical protein